MENILNLIKEKCPTIEFNIEEQTAFCTFCSGDMDRTKYLIYNLDKFLLNNNFNAYYEDINEENNENEEEFDEDSCIPISPCYYIKFTFSFKNKSIEDLTVFLDTFNSL